VSKRKRIEKLEREMAELRDRIAALEARPIYYWPPATEPYRPLGPVISDGDSTAGALPKSPVIGCYPKH